MSVQEYDDVECEDCGCYGKSGFICEECVNKKIKTVLLAKQAEVLKVVEDFFRERQRVLGKDSVVITLSGQPMDEKIKFKAMVAAALQGDALIMEAVLKKRLLGGVKKGGKGK